ncbi:MAG TPA: hypothetical protein VIG99_10960 [Myxococcaceae bacterium]
MIAASSVETWRLFRLLFVGTSAVMDSAGHEETAAGRRISAPRVSGTGARTSSAANVLLRRSRPFHVSSVLLEL